MPEVKCPHCGKIFQVDESGYAQIAQQIRDQEFTAELKRREKELKAKKDGELRIARMEHESERKRMMSEKDGELAEKDREIAQLKSQLKQGETEQQLAVAKAIQEKDDELAETKRKISELNGKIKQGESEKKLAIAEAIQEKDKELNERELEITRLNGEIKSEKASHELATKEAEEFHKKVLAEKEKQIEFYKDFKARQSTKMIGESLEQYCLTQFNQIRMTAFPNAYFEKDNDVRTGSKGDFIFRESSGDGVEFISIMFEMKNEADTTATKHKNEDFFKKLDKDRQEKKCEYAVLVSLLEGDSDFYNTGIVDVSYRYPKMYVVRPQFFIPIITLLRNAAQNSLCYQQELQTVRNQQIDITHFEENMLAFQEAFGRNYRLAREKFRTAIEEIDKSISHLQKIKEALTSSENQLRLANEKAENLSVKKLTKNAPAVQEMFNNLEKDDA